MLDLNENQKIILFGEIGCFKKEYPDFVYDYGLICKDLADYFGSEFDYTEKLLDKAELMEKTQIKPQLDNRFYIVTYYDDIVLAVVNMDEAVIDNFLKTFKYYWISDDAPERIMGSYVSSLYVFRGENMVLKQRISPFTVAQLIAAFKTENLVDFRGVRDAFYGAPRRRKKSFSSLDSIENHSNKAT